MRTPYDISSKVLFVAPDDKYGGIGAVVRMYSKHIKGIKFIATYPSVPLQSKLLFFILSIAEITKALIIDKQIQIIHLHSASSGSFIRKILVALLAKAFRKRVIFHMHGGSFNSFYESAFIFKPLIRYILKCSDKVICLSPEWHNYYVNHLDISRVDILPNPVELSTDCNNFSISPVIKLLFLGKICDNKGIFTFIEYLKSNKYFLDNRIHLAIGGVGEDLRLLADISSLHNIQFHGWADDVMKKHLLEECDIFILPSRYEGLPVSILEAMANYKPIIATNVGGISSIVKTGYNGWLISPDNHSQLDIVFDEIFDNRALLYQYGQNSYTEALKYSAVQVIEKLCSIYHSISS